MSAPPAGAGEGVLRDRADKTGEFRGAFLLHAQQHEEGAELLGQHRAGEIIVIASSASSSVRARVRLRPRPRMAMKRAKGCGV